MNSPVVARLLVIQQELSELQTLTKPTPAALERLQHITTELQALQTGAHSPPAHIPLPLPPVPDPPPPVFAGYNNFFPLYGAEPQGCGGCGACAVCCDPCAPAACGNPLPLSVFQGPNGCAPAYTIQGPPGLKGDQGPTGPAGNSDFGYASVYVTTILNISDGDVIQFDGVRAIDNLTYGAGLFTLKKDKVYQITFALNCSFTSNAGEWRVFLNDYTNNVGIVGTNITLVPYTTTTLNGLYGGVYTTVYKNTTASDINVGIKALKVQPAGVVNLTITESSMTVVQIA